MPNLNVDFDAVEGDERYDLLARLGGYVDRDHARGKLEHVWLACTKRGTDSLAIWAIDTKMGRGAAAALVASELGEFEGEIQGELFNRETGEYACAETAKVRIKGFRKRGDWYAKPAAQISKSNAKGGQARAANAARIGGRFVKTETPAFTSVLNVAGDAGTSDAPATHQRSPAFSQVSPASPALLDLSYNYSENRAHEQPKKKKNNAAAGSNSPPRDPPTPAPVTNLAPDWAPTQQQQQRCADLFLNFDGEVAKFRAHARRHARQFDNPVEAFTFWIERSVDFREAKASTRRAANPPRTYGQNANVPTVKPRFNKL